MIAKINYNITVSDGI